MLAGLAAVWWARVAGRTIDSVAAQADVGRWFHQALAATQFALAVLVAPAATTGAVCQDRQRGTLAHLLVTDLSSGEIILGKLATRLVPVVGMFLCGVPFLALGTLLGGIDAASVFALLLVTLGAAVLGCTVALSVSIWGTRLTEVVLATYAIWLIVILLPPIWFVLRLTGAPPWPLPRWLQATTPLSTRSIILGKWWGTFRVVPLLALPAGLAAGTVAWHHGHPVGVVVIVALITAYGAALTSLGLALASWVPRLSRAVGLSAAAHVCVAVGWVVFIAILLRRTRRIVGRGVASFRPFFGVLLPTMVMQMSSLSEWNQTLGWVSFWTLIDAALAALLLTAIFMSFNPCVGRFDGSRGRRRKGKTARLVQLWRPSVGDGVQIERECPSRVL
jgi:hypothetical protein